MDVVVITNHVTFLTNRFPRLFSLPTSAIYVSATSGITAILKYRSVNPISLSIKILFFLIRTYTKKQTLLTAQKEIS